MMTYMNGRLKKREKLRMLLKRIQKFKRYSQSKFNIQYIDDYA